MPWRRRAPHLFLSKRPGRKSLSSFIKKHPQTRSQADPLGPAPPSTRHVAVWGPWATWTQCLLLSSFCAVARARAVSGVVWICLWLPEAPTRASTRGVLPSRKSQSSAFCVTRGSCVPGVSASETQAHSTVPQLLVFTSTRSPPRVFLPVFLVLKSTLGVPPYRPLLLSLPSRSPVPWWWRLPSPGC